MREENKKNSKNGMNNNFEIQDNSCYVFEGDYVGRGEFGIEVLMMLLLFKIANPEKVFLLRGNHEDCSMNCTDGFVYHQKDKSKSCGSGDKSLKGDESFKQNYADGELFNKYDKKILKNFFVYLLSKIYRTFPVALFVGYESVDGKDVIDYFLDCHATMWPGFDPRSLLSDKRDCLFEQIKKIDYSWLSDELLLQVNNSLNKNKEGKVVSNIDIKNKIKISNLEKLDSKAFVIGYLWHDLDLDKNLKDCYCDKRGSVYSKSFINKLFEYCSNDQQGHRLIGMFKAHQHSEDTLVKMVENFGVFNFWADKRWDGFSEMVFDRSNPVFISNVSPGFVFKFYYQWLKDEERKLFQNKKDKKVEGDKESEGNEEKIEAKVKEKDLSDNKDLLEKKDFLEKKRQEILFSENSYYYNHDLYISLRKKTNKDTKKEYYSIKPKIVDVDVYEL